MCCERWRTGPYRRYFVVEVRKVTLICIAAAIFCLAAYGAIRWCNTRITVGQAAAQIEPVPPQAGPLRPLDAHGADGVKQITRVELERLMTTGRPLSKDEAAQLDRGCLGLTCLYQGLGLRRWPEAARGTLGYLDRGDALKRRCAAGEENFVFVKQAWWLAGKPPKPDPDTGEVPLSLITRQKPGWYTFNYAIYFPETATYAWINHREYGFPLNLFKPQKAYLSRSPPPLLETRPAQLYCSTCR
ncbi:hypothetical protein BH18VER1_BH18VER1_20920 [soil metagenome]